jgi:hypothetical protein
MLLRLHLDSYVIAGTQTAIIKLCAEGLRAATEEDANVGPVLYVGAVLVAGGMMSSYITCWHGRLCGRFRPVMPEALFSHRGLSAQEWAQVHVWMQHRVQLLGSRADRQPRGRQYQDLH